MANLVLAHRLGIAGPAGMLAAGPLPHPWVRTFNTIEELRRGLQDFVAHYNATWLVARHGYRTPNQVRAEQRGLAQCRRGSKPGHTWSWVGAAGMGDGTVGLSSVGRVWTEVLAQRSSRCPRASART
jgi:hypothetical protein